MHFSFPPLLSKVSHEGLKCKAALRRTNITEKLLENPREEREKLSEYDIRGASGEAESSWPSGARATRGFATLARDAASNIVLAHARSVCVLPCVFSRKETLLEVYSALYFTCSPVKPSAFETSPH